MEKIDTDYKQQNLKSLAKLFKPFNRDWAPLNSTAHWPGTKEILCITKKMTQYMYVVAWLLEVISEEFH